MVILAERPFPETVNVCSALAIFAQAVNESGPPLVNIPTQLETVTPTEADPSHFPVSVCLAVSISPVFTAATVIVQVDPTQAAVPLDIVIPLLITLMLEPLIPVPLTEVDPEQIGPVVVGVADIALTTISPVAFTVPQPPVKRML
jgi:hypothetical protein